MALAESALAVGFGSHDRPAASFRWFDPIGLFSGWQAFAALARSAEAERAKTALRYDLVRLVG